MAITLTDRERQFIVRFEDESGATVTDCVVDEEYERVVFVVAPGDMATAIGPDGQTVRGIEDRLGWSIELVEEADTPEAFVANALAPAAVYEVTISSDGNQAVAVVEVDEADMGAAIGKDGRNIESARRLAKRHFDIDDIQLT